MKTFKKILKWIGIALGALILLIIITRTVLDIVFSLQLKETLAELKAQGRPLTVAEITPPPVPDADNTAPLLREAMELMPKWNALTNPPPSALKSLMAFIETNQMPKKVGTDIAGWTDAQREEGAELIQSEEVEDWYALLEKAAQRPHYNNNLDYSQGPNMILPDLSKYRRIFRVLAVKAGFEGQSGSLESALDTILTGLQINNKLGEEPVLITQLVRVASDLLLLEELKRLTDDAEIPAEYARQIMTELSLRADRIPWVKAMDGERVGMGLWVFNVLSCASAKEFLPLLNIDSTQSQARMITCVLLIIRPVIKKDFVIYLTLLSKIQRYFEQPYYRIADNLKQEPLEDQIPRYAMITSLLLPSLEKFCIKIASYEADVEICRVGLALKLFKQKSGAYPETLEQLVPDFLGSIPVDPFTGKSLVYRKDGDGFLLYSLGPNQKDDGGKPQDRADQYGPSSEDYDIAWKCGR